MISAATIIPLYEGGPGSGLGPDAEEAPPPLAHPTSERGSKEKDMARAAPLARRDAGHGGDEGGARAGRARPLGEGDRLVD